MMKICFIYSNRAEYSELKPFIEYFQLNTITKVVDISKKIKKLGNDLNLFKIYEECYKKIFKKRNLIIYAF